MFESNGRTRNMMLHSLVILAFVTYTQALTCNVVPQKQNCTADKTAYCPLNANNTVCKYCDVNTANCVGICSYGIPLAADQQAIVDIHNNYRRKVANGTETRGNPGPQPQAANMIQLVWDAELAKVAQKWTEQCVFGHDVDRQTPKNKGWVGQNIAQSGSSAVPTSRDYAGLIKLWYDEVACFPKTGVNPFKTAGSNCTTGHYTQLAWALTARIGCGYMQRFQSPFYYQFLACNYAPGGNVNDGLGNTAMYIPGTPASKCPTGTTALNQLCKQP